MAVWEALSALPGGKLYGCLGGLERTARSEALWLFGRPSAHCQEGSSTAFWDALSALPGGKLYGCLEGLERTARREALRLSGRP
ncbi:hypothetical protein DPMN_171361 [Dreissena polymorpha]|uniref:Uncharacterized protein n=1 Tax=Dreissena polymorpha TaxID=45954 RepID=A0A9D4E072_DREPO|nr:hypothetical protein DPMN_171361 [Dreissena polymorpha]